MTKAGIEVRGAAHLRRTLRQAGIDISDLKEAHATAAAIASRAARPPVRYGRLASTVRGSGTKTAAIIRAGRASVPYAGVIHWGWPQRGISAQPFLTDAAQATEPAWQPIYLAALNKTINQIEGI